MFELKKKILESHRKSYLKGKGSTLSVGEYFKLKAYLREVEIEINLATSKINNIWV